MHQLARLALSLVGVLLVLAGVSEQDYHPWVSAETEFGEANVPVSDAADLVRSRISIAEFAHVSSQVVHESRGQSDLDIFYARHLVEPATPLIILTGRGSSEVVACALPDTFVSANIFARGGRLDARTCLVDANVDGVFDEIRWSASRADHHSVHSFRVIGFDPPVSISTPYQRFASPNNPSVARQTHLDVAIFYDPNNGYIRGTVTAPDGVVVIRDRMRLPRVGSRARVFEFFGFAFEVTRIGEDRFEWHAIHVLREGAPFRLSYDYRR